jgi:hypothetical protein
MFNGVAVYFAEAGADGMAFALSHCISETNNNRVLKGTQ